MPDEAKEKQTAQKPKENRKEAEKPAEKPEVKLKEAAKPAEKVEVKPKEAATGGSSRVDGNKSNGSSRGSNSNRDHHPAAAAGAMAGDHACGQMG